MILSAVSSLEDLSSLPATIRIYLPLSVALHLASLLLPSFQRYLSSWLLRMHSRSLWWIFSFVAFGCLAFVVVNCCCRCFVFVGDWLSTVLSTSWFAFCCGSQTWLIRAIWTSKLRGGAKKSYYDVVASGTSWTGLCSHELMLVIQWCADSMLILNPVYFTR